MSIYFKANGNWIPVKRPYLKVNGVWKPALEALIKDAGAWEQSYEYDVTPSAIPELSLQIIDSRYIKVGARLPGAGHDSDLKRIRVLYLPDKSPTTPFGDGYRTAKDSKWDKENWSDWYFNGMNTESRSDSSVYTFKTWPADPGDKTNLPGGQYYYFAAWSEDMEGNWSAGVFHKIWMPKGDVTQRRVLKEMRVRPNEMGTMIGPGADSWRAGRAEAQANPRRNGMLFYGNQITDSIGFHSKNVTIRSAKIRLARDTYGSNATAKPRLFWHREHLSSFVYGDWGSANHEEVTVIGELNKGEAKWFDLPSTWHNNLQAGVKGIGIQYGTLAQNYVSIKGPADDPRAGELHIVWEEDL